MTDGSLIGLKRMLFAFMASALVIAAPAQGQNRRYVDVNAQYDGDGLSWHLAYNFLNDALDDAMRDRTIREIWVAGGVYKPNYGSSEREGTFTLVPGVAVYGGFHGGEDYLPPPWQRNEVSILSGDIGVQGDNSDNNYSVVTLPYAFSGCILDNFTIEGGNGTWGGGVKYQVYNDHTIISNCTFRDNYARWGGALFLGSCLDARIVNCTFEGNSSGAGGAVYCTGEGATMNLVNCLFVNNLGGAGGAISVYGGPFPRFRNCTFVGNVATGDGGAISVLTSFSYASLENSIVFGNSPNSIDMQMPETFFSSSSCIQGGWEGEGNIDADPRFVSIADGDYRLLPGSPCIDAGDNRALPWNLTLDLDWNARVLNDPNTPDTGHTSRRWRNAVVDMGCYEFQP